MFFVLSLLIGGGAILFGVLSKKRDTALKKSCTAQTSGTVIRVDVEVRSEEYEDEEEEREEYRIKTREVTTYYPVFEYSAGGQSYTQKGEIGTGRPQYQTGAQVTICYNPNKPDEFYVDGDSSGSRMGIILIVAGVCIILAGLVLSFL